MLVLNLTIVFIIYYFLSPSDYAQGAYRMRGIGQGQVLVYIFYSDVKLCLSSFVTDHRAIHHTRGLPAAWEFIRDIFDML